MGEALVQRLTAQKCQHRIAEEFQLFVIADLGRFTAQLRLPLSRLRTVRQRLLDKLRTLEAVFQRCFQPGDFSGLHAIGRRRIRLASVCGSLRVASFLEVPGSLASPRQAPASKVIRPSVALTARARVGPVASPNSPPEQRSLPARHISTRPDIGSACPAPAPSSTPPLGPGSTG